MLFIIELADKLCPVRNYRVKSNKPQWLTREVLEAQKDRDYFYSKAMSTGDEGDWFIARQMRNIANKMTRSAKAEFVKGELELTSDDPRKFWRRIKEHVLPDCKTVTLNLVDEYTSESIPDEDMPNRVNDFFTDIGLNIASRIRQWK